MNDESGLRTQRRGRRIAMDDGERDAFLTEQRTCRVATTGPDGPHATPLWFVWDGSLLWLYSIVRSRRWADLRRDPRLGVVVDTGEQYDELRGIEIVGVAEVIGDVPRTGTPDDRLTAVETQFARKYADPHHRGDTAMGHDGRHAWLRVTPSKITSWDFRKLADLA